MTIISSLIPKDAPYMRSLFNESLQAGRLKGFVSGCLMVPLAGMQVPVYALRGIKNGVVSILHLDFRNGIHSFCSDEFSALKCLALTVGSIAYAVLKLLNGSSGKSSAVTGQDRTPAPPAPTLPLSPQEQPKEDVTPPTSSLSIEPALEAVPPLNAEIHFYPTRQLQYLVKLAVDPQYKEIGAVLDFFRRNDQAAFMHYFFHATTSSKDAPVYRLQLAEWNNPVPKALESGELKDDQKNVIGDDSADLFFSVSFNHLGSKENVKLDLPSTLFFDDDGKVKEPISFYWEDKLYTVSFKACLEHWRRELNEDYFTPEKILSLRSYHLRHKEILIDHTENNNLFSLVSDQALMFDEAGSLVPFTQRKVKRNPEMELAKHSIYKSPEKFTFVFDTVGCKRSSITVVLDPLHQAIYFHAVPTPIDLTNKYVLDQMPSSNPRAYYHKFDVDVDLSKATLKIENGLCTLIVPKN